MSAHIRYTEKTNYSVYSCPCGKSKVYHTKSIEDSGDISWFMEPRGIHVGLMYSRCNYCNNYYYNGNSYFQDLRWYEKVLFILCYNTYFLPSIRMLSVVGDLFPFPGRYDKRVWVKLVHPFYVIPICLMFVLLLGMDCINFALITALNIICLPYNLIANPIKIIRSKNGYYERIDSKNRPSSIMNDLLSLLSLMRK